jgi:ADP-ribose pyrophosphatase
MVPRQFPPLPSHPDAEILSDETVWRGRFQLQVVRFRNRRFDGRMSGPRTWEVWRRGRGAALLPYDPDADAVVLIEQFRLPALAAGLDPVLVEIPAGLCDPGEDARTTLLREAREEMRLTPQRLEPIGDFVLSPGSSDECVTVFVGQVAIPPAGADGLLGRAGLAEEQEDIQVRVWPAARAIEAALAGRFANSVTTIALLWLAIRRDGLRQRWSAAP